MVNTNSDFPVKGDKMLAKYADKSYAKVFTHNTIGLSSTSVFYSMQLFVLGSDLVNGL